MSVELLVRKLRIRDGLTQRELGEKLRVQGQYIHNCENGQTSFSPKHFKKISKTFDIPIKTLVNRRIKEFKANLNKTVGL